MRAEPAILGPPAGSPAGTQLAAFARKPTLSTPVQNVVHNRLTIERLALGYVHRAALAVSIEPQAAGNMDTLREILRLYHELQHEFEHGYTPEHLTALHRGVIGWSQVIDRPHQAAV